MRIPGMNVLRMCHQAMSQAMELYLNSDLFQAGVVDVKVRNVTYDSRTAMFEVEFFTPDPPKPKEAKDGA